MDSEQALIGSIFMNPMIFPQVRGDISQAHFLNEKNRSIYSAFLSLANDGHPIDPETVCNEMKKAGTADNEYVGEIIQSISTAAGYAYHVKELRDQWAKRKLLELAAHIETNKTEQSAEQLISKTRKYLMKLTERTHTKQLYPLIDCLKDTLKQIEETQARQGLSGITTGFPTIDKYTGGLQPGELVIIAGRPGMGKSVMLKDLLENAGVPGLCFSLEMSRTEFVKRQLAGKSGVNFELIRTSRIYDADDWSKIMKASEVLGELQLRYNDDADISIDDIVAISEAEAMKGDVGIIGVDYLQLIQGHNEKREREVAEISRRLKVLARSLHIPIICLSQLNRSCESRTDKRPLMSDLRESGAIEQDADIVAFLYRDCVYNSSACKTDAEFIIRKGRNIRTGVIDLHFDGAHQTFKSRYHDEMEA